MTGLPVLTRQAVEAWDHLLLPIWVFSVETQRILAANASARRWIGHDLPTLRSMTIADLRPETDRARLVDAVRRFDGAQTDAGTWNIVDSAGELHTAQFGWSRVSFDGAEAIVASIRDMTPLTRAEALAERLSTQNAALQTRVGLSATHLSHLVDGLPGKMLVLTPGDHRVVAVTDEYAQAVMLARDSLIGRRLFDLFPGDPAEPQADGAASLRASLRRVEAMGVTDVMSLQCYPVRQPDGVFQERFWLPTNKPVLDARGKIIYIVHRVEDVTALVGQDGSATGLTSSTGTGHARQLSEAQTALLALREREARLEAAEKLLDLGAWEHDFDSGALNWSDRVFEMYGVARDRGTPDFDGYVALVHPDDQAQMVLNYRHFFEAGLPQIEFQHRIVRADGSVTYVRGVGSRHRVDGREIVIGFVQDVTAIRQTEEDLRHQAKRRRFAGRLVKLGTWRYELGQTHVTWDDETAAIHGEPTGTSPPVDTAIAYYVAEHRDRIRERLESCVRAGEPFDEVCRIVDAQGLEVWVRAIGEPVRDASGRIVAVEGAFQDISDLIEARDAATQLSDRLRGTLEGMSDAFYLLDAQWRITFINSMAEKLLQRDRVELLGRLAWDVFPEAAGSIRTHYERALAEGRLLRFEEFYAPLRTWFEITADPTPHGLAVYFRDITQQRAREAQLRLLEAAAARLNDILLITEAEPIDGPDGPRIVYVNDAFERRTGYSRAEAIGQTPRILQGPKTQREELDRIRQALRKWQPVRTELINHKKSGEAFWLELDIVPLADETGWYTHWVAIERDISDRKHAEQVLESKEERFRLVTKAARTAIWDWDLRTGQSWWSDGLQDIFGHAPDATSATPVSWRSHVHPDDQARVGAAFDRLVAGQDEMLRETFRFRRADGTWAIVENSAFALRDPAGSVVRVLGSMTDVTDRSQLEERLRQAQKMEVVGQLTGGVAHDFNNLLTVILGNAEILEEALSGQPALQRLARMSLDAADRGAQLTSRLLAFSRRQPLKPEVLDVARLIHGMDGLLRRTLPESIDVRIVRTDGLWQIEADSAQLESALLNLVVNARDAMPDGGSLTIEAANVLLDEDYAAAEPDVQPGQHVAIVVTDTGHGIARHLIGSIFEPFFTTKEVGKGSGLGLSMVFGFVKQTGGHIRVYSEPGEGSSFKLYFPRARSEREPAVAERAGPKVAGGIETILVVEDDESVRSYVCAELRALGYRVLEAAGGGSAVDVLHRIPDVDLLFTDVVMPGGMSGPELAQSARSMRPGIKVLFTSGYTENSIIHNGRLDVGVRLLSKPYRREQLAAKVREALDEMAHGDA